MTDEIVVVTPTASPLDPRTGEPRRPWAVRAATGALYLGGALVIAGLLQAMWLSVDAFAEAAWLHRVIATGPGDLVRVALVTGTTVVALIVTAAAVITAHYAWWGYDWTRWAGLVAVALAPLTLMVNPLAAAGIAPIALGAGLLWLPTARTFRERWRALRRPPRPEAAVAGDVFYGPLPRYR